MRVRGEERREVRGQARDDQLEQLIQAPDVLQMVCAEVPHVDAIREVMRHEVEGFLGKQHLPAMGGAHDTRRAMHIQSDIPFFSWLWLAGMQPYTHAHGNLVRPLCAEKRLLHGNSRRNRVASAFKNRKKGIALRIDFVAVPLLKCRAQQAAMLLQYEGIALPKLLKQTG